VLTELFLLGATAEALWVNIDWKLAISLQRDQFDPKFQVEGVTPTDHSSQKTRLNGLSYGIKIWTECFFHFVTIHAFDGQTNTFRITSPRWLPCSTEKIKRKL